MDVNAIKSNASNQAPASSDEAKGAAFSLGDSALSFLALMQNTKTRLAGNITQMMESNRLSRSIEGAEPAFKPAERTSDNGHDVDYDRYRERADGATRPEDRVDVPRHDDGGNDNSRPVADRGGEPDPGDDGHQETRHDPTNGEHDQSADASGADDTPTTNQTAGEPGQKNEPTSDSPSAGEGSAKPNGDAQTESAHANGGAGLTGDQRTQDLFASLLPTAEISAPPGQISALPGQASALPGQASALPGQASALPRQASALLGQASAALPQASALPGQASALPGQASALPEQASALTGQASALPGRASALPGQAVEQAGAGDMPGHNAQKGLFTAPNAVSTQGSGANHPGAHDAGQRLAGQARTAVQPPIQASAEAETVGSANTVTERQAAALSRTIGEGNRVSVQVKVTDETATLISQPRSALTSKAALDSEAGNQSRNNRSLAPDNAPTNLQGAINPAVQKISGSAQGQIQQAAGQSAQALTGATTDGKGLVQTAIQANTAAQGGQAIASDAAVPASSSGTTETGPPQKTNAAQAANTQTPLAQSKAVAEQISVQISKAIEAGVDRINIQLKPESMGRIDVKLDIGLDGRVMVVVTADNKNTLDLMERDQRSLEQALQDAGLNTDAGNMSFNLREQSKEGSDERTAKAASPEDELTETAEADLDDLLAAIKDGDFGPDGRVDIRA